jgi:hypothetical protein
MLRLALM